MNPHAPQNTLFTFAANVPQNLFTDNAYVYGMIFGGTGLGVITVLTRTDPTTDPDLAASWDVTLNSVIIGIGPSHWMFAYPVLIDKGLRITATIVTTVTLFHSHIAT